MNPRALFAVAVGGLMGAALRWAMIEIIPDGRLHWGLLAANAAGCAVFGLLFGRPTIVDELRSELRLAATTGFCGSLTTLSGFSFVAAVSLRDGDMADVLAFVCLALATGLGAAWSARRLQRVLSR